MQKFNLKGAVPHLVALAAFLIITVLYFQPLFQGKKIYQGDIVNYKGMSQELIEHRETTGEEALWTNRMFGGMPAYQISHRTPTNLLLHVDRLIGFNFPREASFVLIALIGFYILLLSMGVAPPFAIAGAIGFGLTSYLFIIIEAGHNTKAHAMAYMAPVLAGIIMAYRGKLLKGAAITALFLALQLRANHLQITYYLLFMVLVFGVFELVYAIKEKKVPKFLKTFLVLVFAAMLAIGANIEKIWTTYEYGKYSTRSQSELTIDGNQDNKTTGLNKDYATSWSYGLMETFNLMIPNFMGGASGAELSKDSETYRVLKQNRVPNVKNVIKRMPTAKLSHDQYDIDTLPPYDILDVILKSFIEEKKSLDEICNMGYERNLVTKIINMVIGSEYKRRQYSPGVKVNPESFGRDRRFPIVSKFKY